MATDYTYEGVMDRKNGPAGQIFRGSTAPVYGQALVPKSDGASHEVALCATANYTGKIWLYDPTIGNLDRLDSPDDTAIALIESGVCAAKMSGTGALGDKLITASNGWLQRCTGAGQNVQGEAMRAWTHGDTILINKYESPNQEAVA